MQSTTNNAPKRAAIYIRSALRNPAAINAQRQACTEYVRARPDWTLAGEYVDTGASANDLQRPALQRLITHTTEGRIEAVVTMGPDRLARSHRDLQAVIRSLAPASVSFVSEAQ